MAVVDPTLIYGVTAGVVLLIILIVTLVNKLAPSKKEKNEKEIQPVGPPRARAMEGPQGMRRRGPRPNRMRLQQQDDSDENDDGDSTFDDIPQQEDKKIGAKKLAKLQRKAEQKAMREQEERDREDKKKKDKEYEERKKAEEELEKKAEAEREEEERKAKEERERIEHEEYLKFKEMMSIDDEGEGEQEADLNSESLLDQFINYIKETKVVMMEDLAGHFALKTQDVINRVQDLQAEGRLTGVIDDRGKFIYITMEELEAVARFIRQNGRVSISDLAASSNKLINLDSETSSIARKFAAEITEEGKEEIAI